MALCRLCLLNIDDWNSMLLFFNKDEGSWVDFLREESSSAIEPKRDESIDCFLGRVTVSSWDCFSFLEVFLTLLGCSSSDDSEEASENESSSERATCGLERVRCFDKGLKLFPNPDNREFLFSLPTVWKNDWRSTSFSGMAGEA